MSQPSLLDQPIPRFDGADIRSEDHRRLAGQLARVFAVLADGRWYSVSQIAAEIFQRDGIRDPEPSISAQLRNLRKPRMGGYEIQRRRDGNLSAYRYVPEAL